MRAAISSSVVPRASLARSRAGQHRDRDAVIVSTTRTLSPTSCAASSALWKELRDAEDTCSEYIRSYAPSSSYAETKSCGVGWAVAGVTGDARSRS